MPTPKDAPYKLLQRLAARPRILGLSPAISAYMKEHGESPVTAANREAEIEAQKKKLDEMYGRLRGTLAQEGV